VSRYQKGKTNVDFTGARDSEWQWNPLGHMQVCTMLQADNYTSTPPLNFFTGRMPFLPPNQQRQSTEGLTQSFSSSCCTRKFYVTPSYIAKNYYCRNFFKYYIPQNMRWHLMTNTFGNDSNSNCY